MTLSFRWHDAGRIPRAAPDPRFPNGLDVDLSCGATRTCSTLLPYPAKRIGMYSIECLRCGLTAAVTTAGRPDDPRSVKVACKGLLETVGAPGRSGPRRELKA
jgi:hypothetical protein